MLHLELMMISNRPEVNEQKVPSFSGKIIYRSGYLLHNPRQCWPTFIQNLPVNLAVTCLYDVPRTHDVGIPTMFWFDVASQPISGSMKVNRLRRWPTLIQHWLCCILCTSTSANTWLSPNIVSMSTQRVLDAGPTLKQLWVSVLCLLGSQCPWRLSHQSPERPFPNNRIHWPNADAGPQSTTLGQHYSNLKPFELKNIIVMILFLNNF